MLVYQKNGQAVVLNCDNYYIQEEWFGADDSLCFSLGFNHPQLPDMLNQLSLTDKESGQAFLITKTDEGDITAQIDLDEFRSEMYLNWTNNSDTAGGTILQVLPNGWTLLDNSQSSIRRTVKMEGATALEILREVANIYGLAIRFDRKTKQVLLKNPDNIEPTGVYFSDELNLRKQPVCTSQSKNFATRLYAVGKDGMTFADINDGKSYVDNNEYSNRIVSAYWSDDRYTVKENLLADAKKKLSEMAKPSQSYQCDVVDLAKIDHNQWAYLTVEMYQGVVLMDRVHHKRLIHTVVQYRKYPHYPERNIITLSTLPGTISNKVEQTYQAVSNPNSDFQQQLDNNLQNVASSITGAKGGYKKDILDQNGKPSGTLYMDTDNEATAKNIIRINHQGIAFTNHGSAGPWTQAITIDGGLANKWIETWQLTANIIVAGMLQSKNGKSFWNLDTGEMNLNGTFESVLNRSRIEMTAGILRMYIDGKEILGLANTKDTISGLINIFDDGLLVMQLSQKGVFYNSKWILKRNKEENSLNADIINGKAVNFEKLKPHPNQNTLYTNWLPFPGKDGVYVLAAQTTPWRGVEKFEN